MGEFAKNAKFKLNGRTVLTAAETDCSIKSNDTPVYTLAEGLAGFSDGAAEVDMTVQNPVPATGIEVDWQGLALDHVTIDLGIEIAGREYVARGRVINASLQSAVNQAVKGSMSFHGKIISRPPRT